MVTKINEFLKNHKYSKPLIVVLFIIALVILYNDKNKTKNAPENRVSVLATKVVISDVPIYLSALGTVTPDYTANIQAQVTGQIFKINFADGQEVKKNDVLVEVDPSVYQAQVTQYEGQLARDKALLDNALIDLKRYKELWKENSISNQTLATQVALVDQYKGTVKIDQGLLDNANINLGFCKIKAPFDGKMGIALLREGNIVNSSTNIAIINVQQPISVLFNVPESNLMEICEAFIKNNKLVVEVYDRYQDNLMSKGELLAIDNQINTSTGTIQLRAKFDNSNYDLFPNQFVNVKLLLKTLKNYTIVPASAVQYGPNGPFVYLIDGERAKMQLVSIETLSEGKAVIKEGVLPDQIVVTVGGDRLSEGALLNVSDEKGK